MAVRAQFADEQGDEDEAQRWIEASLSAAPEHPFVLRCANAVLGVSQRERAVALVRRWEAMRTYDPLPTYALFMLYVVGHDEGAMAELAEAPPPAVAGTWRGELMRYWVALRNRRLAVAEEHARRAVALMPEHESTWLALAMTLHVQGRKSEAAEAVRFVLEIDRREPSAMRILADALDAQGQPRQAEAWRQKAKDAAPALAFIEPLHRSNAFRRDGRTREALAALEPLKKGHSFALRLYHAHRVRILIDLEDDAALANEVGRLQAVAPEHETNLLGRAEVARRRGHLDEALEILVQQWEEGRSPQMAAPILSLLIERKDHNAARRFAQELVDDVPPYPAATVMVCLAMERGGLQEEAARFLDAARRRFPEYQSLQVLNVAALRKAGNIVGAREAFHRLEPGRKARLRRRFARQGRLLERLKAMIVRLTRR